MKKDADLTGLLEPMTLEDVVDYRTAELYYERVVRQAETKEERRKLADQLIEWCEKNNIPTLPGGIA